MIDDAATNSSESPAVDIHTEKNRTLSARTREQLRLLGDAVRHIRKVQGATSRVTVLAITVPSIAQEQAVEADEQVDQALKCLEALESSLKEGP